MGSVVGFIIAMIFLVRSVMNYFLLIENNFLFMDRGYLSLIYFGNIFVFIMSLLWVIAFGVMILSHIAVGVQAWRRS